MRIKRLDESAPYFDDVVRWLYEEWHPIPPADTLSSTRRELRRRAGGVSIPCTYMAESDVGVPLGTVSLVSCDYEPRRELSPWLADLFVPPQYRANGIGSALVVYLEKAAAAAGTTRLYLLTRHRQRLYERLGWQVIEPISYQGESAALMAKDLTSVCTAC